MVAGAASERLDAEGVVTTPNTSAPPRGGTGLHDHVDPHAPEWGLGSALEMARASVAPGERPLLDLTNG